RVRVRVGERAVEVDELALRARDVDLVLIQRGERRRRGGGRACRDGVIDRLQERRDGAVLHLVDARDGAVHVEFPRLPAGRDVRTCQIGEGEAEIVLRRDGE